MTTNLENFIITAELLKQAAAEQEQEMRTVANPLGIGAAVGGGALSFGLAATDDTAINNMVRDAEYLRSATDHTDSVETAQRKAIRAWKPSGYWDDSPEHRVRVQRFMRPYWHDPIDADLPLGVKARVWKDKTLGIRTNHRNFIPRYGKSIGGLTASLLPTLWGLGNLKKEVPTPQQPTS